MIYAKILYACSRLPSHVSTKLEYFINIFRNISTQPSSTINLSIPINDWEYTESLGPSSGDTSISRWQLFLMVIYDLGVNFMSFPFSQSSTLLVSNWTYCDRMKSHALAPLSFSNFITVPPRYILLNPIDSFFHSK